VKQVNNYYPSGTSMAERRTDQGVQPYKFGGKELDRTNNLDFYDFINRGFDPVVMRFTRPDPLAIKYSWMSTYAYCANNPVNIIDPTGMDWYWDKDKVRQYNPDLTKDNQAEKLGKGETYIGATDQVKDDKGNVTEDYRKDGSIMYSKESKGYARVWDNSQKIKKEEMGIITDKGVLVVPDYKNEPRAVAPEKYGYSWTNGNIKDADGNLFNVLGTIHTHQDKKGDATSNSHDMLYFGERTPNKVFMVMGHDEILRAYRATGIGTQYEWITLPIIKGIDPTIVGLMNGYQMKELLKQNRNK